MFGGGQLRLDPYRVQDTGNDKVINESELRQGIIDSSNGNPVDEAKLTEDTLILYKGKLVRYGDLRDEVVNIRGKVDRQGRLRAQESPKDIWNRSKQKAVTVGEKLSGEIAEMKKALKEGKEFKADGKTLKGETLEAAIAEKTQSLRSKIDQIRQANQFNSTDSDADIPEHWFRDAGIARSTRQSGTGQGNGQTNFKASRGGNSGGGAPAGENAGGAPSSGAPYGANWSGPPANSAAYMNALQMDGSISDGLGATMKSRREGQKLMMLFFYYVRMAASGDLGAMYQLIQFINYMIAKDKARQNIKISSKLIQLQDMSRKATDALMAQSTDGKDQKQQNDFMKSLHKAKSDEATISTSQKLLADMLQEFAHVVEAMTNSSKFLLDAWGRVMRTVTRP